jgi:hypothetical protein
MRRGTMAPPRGPAAPRAPTSAPAVPLGVAAAARSPTCGGGEGVGIPGRHGPSHLCIMQSILVFIRRVTARYRSKGSNGSKSHPKAGSSWPMAYP